MLDFKPQYRIQSLVRPGVWLTINRLSTIARANRDLALADVYDEIEEIRRAVAPLLPRAVAGGEPEMEKSSECIRLERRQYRLLRAKVMPEILAAGIAKIEKDDAEISIEDFIATASDDLVDEAYVLCEAASKLSPEQLKNLESPGTSPEPATAVQGESTIAAIAEKAA